MILVFLFCFVCVYVGMFSRSISGDLPRWWALFFGDRLIFFPPFSLLYLVSRPLVLCRRIFFLVDSRFVAWVCAPPRPFSSSVVGGDEGGIFWHQSETIRGLNFCTEMTTRADHQNAPGRIRKGPPRVKERKKKDRERQFRYVTAVDPRHFFPAPIPHTRALCM